ncbi:hypothetical protein ACFL1D_00755 [Candidatus Omnitrophota bacterium]
MVREMKYQVIAEFRPAIIALSCLSILLGFSLAGFSQSDDGLVPQPPGKQKVNARGKPIEENSVDYTASGLRDPFYSPLFAPVEKAKPAPMSMSEGMPVEVVIPRKISEMFSFSIQGIIWNSNNPIVIINNQVLRKGDTLIVTTGKGATEEVTVEDIVKDGVTIGYAGLSEKFALSGIARISGIRK